MKKSSSIVKVIICQDAHKKKDRKKRKEEKNTQGLKWINNIVSGGIIQTSEKVEGKLVLKEKQTPAPKKPHT